MQYPTPAVGESKAAYINRVVRALTTSGVPWDEAVRLARRRARTSGYGDAQKP